MVSIQVEGTATTSSSIQMSMIMGRGFPMLMESGSSPAAGGFAAYEDGFSMLELTRTYYRQAGLDARELDLLIR